MLLKQMLCVKPTEQVQKVLWLMHVPLLSPPQLRPDAPKQSKHARVLVVPSAKILSDVLVAARITALPMEGSASQEWTVVVRMEQPAAGTRTKTFLKATNISAAQTMGLWIMWLGVKMGLAERVQMETVTIAILAQFAVDSTETGRLSNAVRVTKLLVVLHGVLIPRDPNAPMA